MNDQAIARHFRAMWKQGIIFVEALPVGRYLISDGYSAFALPREHPTFDSRRMFPELPADDEAWSYAPSKTEKRSSFIKAWEDSKGIKQRLVPSPWLFIPTSDCLARALTGRAKSVVYLNDRYLALLGGPLDLGLTYTFRGEGPSNIVAVDRDGLQVAVIMPVKLGGAERPPGPWIE